MILITCRKTQNPSFSVFATAHSLRSFDAENAEGGLFFLIGPRLVEPTPRRGDDDQEKKLGPAGNLHPAQL